MPQFQLSQTPCKIDNFNPRVEKHGETHVPAGDIKVTVSVHSQMLDVFHKGLRPLLFRKPDLAGEIDSLFPGEELTQVAMPKLKPLVIDEQFTGYRLEISAGLDFSEPEILTDVKLSNFKLEPVNGGAAKISFSAACHPTEEQAGWLCQMIQEQPFISVIAPGQPVQSEIPQDQQNDTLDEQEAQAERDRLAKLGE